MNKVILIGNLTRDPELSQIPSGISVCRMSIAVNRTFTNASGEREVDFFNITAWRGLGENCHRFLKKGLKIGVSGSLRTSSYEQDGVKKSYVEVVADDIEFLSPRGEGGMPAESDSPAQPKKSIRDNPPIDDDSLPF